MLKMNVRADRPRPSGTTPVTAAQVAAEVLELQSFRDLARSIRKNAKGERLASETAGTSGHSR